MDVLLGLSHDGVAEQCMAARVLVGFVAGAEGPDALARWVRGGKRAEGVQWPDDGQCLAAAVDVVAGRAWLQWAPGHDVGLERSIEHCAMASPV